MVEGGDVVEDLLEQRGRLPHGALYIVLVLVVIFAVLLFRLGAICLGPWAAGRQGTCVAVCRHRPRCR